MIAVIGATGNVGSKLTQTLLSRGEKIRVMARSADKLEPLKNQGAEVVIGDVTNVEDLKLLFKGASSAFVMIPPAYGVEDFLGYMAKASENIVSALATSQIRHVVNLSSLGAHRDSYVGPVRGLHDHEKRLAKLNGISILNLRPTYFMENFLANLPLIQNQKINGGGIKKGVKFPVIATKDISAFAVERLVKLDFAGTTHQDLLGPEDLDVETVTQAFGEALKVPNLPYVEFSYPDVKRALLGFGFANQAADLMVELTEGLNLGKFNELAKRDVKISTPTRFREFLKSALSQSAS